MKSGRLGIKYVIFFFMVFYVITNVFIVYLGSNVIIWDGETEGG